MDSLNTQSKKGCKQISSSGLKINQLTKGIPTIFLTLLASLQLAVAESYQFQIDVGSMQKDYLKVIYNTGSNTADQVFSIFFDGPTPVKTYQFESKEEITNVRLLWHEENELTIRFIQVISQNDTLHWDAASVLSNFLYNWLIPEKTINDGVLFLRSSPAKDGAFPFMAFNNVGIKTLGTFYNPGKFKHSKLVITAFVESLTPINIFTGLEFEEEPTELSAAGVLMPGSWQQLELPTLVDTSFEALRIVMYSKEPGEINISEIVLDGQELNKQWNARDIDQNFEGYGYKAKTRTMNSITYSIETVLDIRVKNPLKPTIEERLIKVGLLLLFIVSAGFFLFYNKAILARISLSGK